MEGKVSVEPVAGSEHSAGDQILPARGNALLANNIPSADILREPSQAYYIAKRLIDVVIATLGIILLLPVFLIIALCIKLDDKGAVFHFREIAGLHGRRFFALKFRTMISDADSYLERHPQLLQEYQQRMKLANDPRVTHVGRFLRKTSLDELPQLFNVLVGKMSLVGPRMIHPSELPRYGDFAPKRLSVKPGITGFWQISARRNAAYEDRIPYDLHYIDNRSFMGDLIILLKTLKIFLHWTGK